MSKYEFKTTPYEHQRKALREAWGKPGFAFLMEMGTGKTKVAIDEAAALFEQDKIDAVLVTCPKSIVGTWATQEIPAHLPDRIPRWVLPWSNNKSRSFRDKVARTMRCKDSTLVWMITNVEAFSSGGVLDDVEEFLSTYRALWIVDESTIIKNPSAKRTQHFLSLGQHALYRRILTGSPATNSPLDLYTQFKFIDSKVWGSMSYYLFSKRYAEWKDLDPTDEKNNQKFPVGWKNMEDLANRIEPYKYRVRKDECLDLPEKVYSIRSVDLTDHQLKIYKELRDYAIVDIENSSGETAQVVAMNALSWMLKLHQVVCGYLPADTPMGKEMVPIKNNRINELVAGVEESGADKFIIWANYIFNIQQICEILSKKYGKEAVAQFHGGTPQEQRQEIVYNFQNKINPRFFVGNTQTAGRGLTLTESNQVFYYSNNYNFELRAQSEDRAHRIGQVNKVNYVDLIAPNTVDEKFIQALRKKLSMASEIMKDGYRKWLI